VASGPPEVERRFSLDDRISPEQRDEMFQRFYRMEKPPAAEARPVPDDIAEVLPEVAGLEWFVLPDGRIALINPETGDIETIL
jgi:hypothetical protein